MCIPLRVGAWAESFSHCARPLCGATAQVRQSMGAALAAEAGSGERGYLDPGQAGRGRWSCGSTQSGGGGSGGLQPRHSEDGRHGRAGEGTHHPLCSGGLPSSRGEGVVAGSRGNRGAEDWFSRRIPLSRSPVVSLSAAF